MELYSAFCRTSREWHKVERNFWSVFAWQYLDVSDSCVDENSDMILSHLFFSKCSWAPATVSWSEIPRSGSEQPHSALAIPIHCKRVGPDGHWWPLPTLMILWFCDDSMKLPSEILWKKLVHLLDPWAPGSAVCSGDPALCALWTHSKPQQCSRHSQSL